MKRLGLFFAVTTLASTISAPGIPKETFIGADFTNGIYSYQLMDKFYETPNTIEAWVRLGYLGMHDNGGVIFGNFCGDNAMSTKVEIDNRRHPSFYWNGGQSIVTFDSYSLPSDTWVHLAFVRETENRAFALYVNGNLEQRIYKSIGTDNHCDYVYIVGGDWSNWMKNKNPFKGEIAQVTVYSDSKSTRDIYKDYLNEDEISYKTRQNLLFNANFEFNAIGANDTSRYANHAILRSNDYFYNGDLYEPEDYSFTVVPDPQILTHWRRNKLPTLSKFIIDKKDEYNTQAVICVGDNSDGTAEESGGMDVEFAAMKAEYDKLRDAGVRWMTTPGNHDYDNKCGSGNRNLTKYNNHFPYSEISTFDYFGGAYKENQSQNTYYLFETCGVKYLILSLEFGADDNVLAWADDVVSAFPDRRCVMFTHGWLGGDGVKMDTTKKHNPRGYSWSNSIQVNNPDQIFEKFVKKHKNMFMVICGHVPSDDLKVLEDVGDNGNIIFEMLCDAQGVCGTAGESIISMLNFDELNQRVSVNMLTTTTRRLYNIQNQFTYSFKGNTDILSSLYYNEDGTLKAS